MGGLGGLSVLHDTRGRGTGQHPLRQLLSGNSGQARGSGGYHKQNFLGGGAYLADMVLIALFSVLSLYFPP